MEKGKVAQDNAMFFVDTVGMSMGMVPFTEAVLGSSLEMAQFGTDIIGDPGYIRIDSSHLRNQGCWFDFVDKVKAGLLSKLTYDFTSRTEIEGDLAEQVVIKRDGYEFHFQIKQYERDSAHGWEIVDPKALDAIPEDEKLGRVVYLTIYYYEQ